MYKDEFCVEFNLLIFLQKNDRERLNYPRRSREFPFMADKYSVGIISGNGKRLFCFAVEHGIALKETSVTRYSVYNQLQLNFILWSNIDRRVLY